MKHIIAVVLIIFIFSSCKTTQENTSKDLVVKDTSSQNTNKALEITGLIAKQGVTTYQYGSHTIKTEKDLYTLKSSNINLDDYIGKTITIVGEKIDGYPISGGPIYVKVLKIKE
jgi:hypothetical protein